MNNSIKILFTDLDGTLLNSSREISRTNRECLQRLGNEGIVRVISTGRSLYSYRKLLGNSVPADYLAFSNGAGIIDLRTDMLLYSSCLEEDQIYFIISHLNHHKADFMVHRTVPDNHYFTYYQNQHHNPDFTRRIKLYQNYAKNSTAAEKQAIRSAQIIAIFPEDLVKFNSVKEGLNGFQVTRTTSPLDGRSIWMEIYPPGVSKGASAKWLCNHLLIDSSSSFGIGNDYNDISLLNFTEVSFVVANSPPDMQLDYHLTSTHDDDGFSQAVNAVTKI